MDQLYKAALGAQTALSKLSIYTDLFQEQYNALATITNSVNEASASLRNVVDSLVPCQVDRILANVNDALNRQVLSKAMDAQMQTIFMIQKSVKTAEVNALLENCSKAAYVSGMEEFVSNFRKGYMPASDFALLKGIKDLDVLVSDNELKDIRPLLNKMHKRTGERLIQNEKLEVDVAGRIFRATSNARTGVGVESVNVAASATELFADFTEDELLEFQDVLSKEIEFASEHPTGKKIFSIIKSWNACIGFDRKHYYHAREKRENGCPYTSAEMGKAPNDVVDSGRFNHAKQSHYYFSDTIDGAQKEVHKHKSKVQLQVACLQPKKEIRMIDLSEEIKTQNLFLQYLRFEPAIDSKQLTEYLIPQYVATCCEKAGIEGIKYYGSQKYKNYVSWSGDYFKVTLV